MRGAVTVVAERDQERGILAIRAPRDEHRLEVVDLPGQSTAALTAASCALQDLFSQLPPSPRGAAADECVLSAAARVAESANSCEPPKPLALRACSELQAVLTGQLDADVV